MMRITIKTEPVAKGRPRTAFIKGKVRTYTPQKTVDAQDFIIRRLIRYKDDCFPPHTPVKLSVVFYRTKGEWIPKKEKLPVRKPDLDNFLKLLLDSINGILVADDAQITTIHLKKRWSKDGIGHINFKLEKDKLGGDNEKNI